MVGLQMHVTPRTGSNLPVYRYLAADQIRRIAFTMRYARAPMAATRIISKSCGPLNVYMADDAANTITAKKPPTKSTSKAIDQ